MNSHAFSLRGVSWLNALFPALLLAFSAAAVDAQAPFADWTTSGPALTHNFTLPSGTTGTVTKTLTSCQGGGFTLMTVATQAHNAGVNYPSTFYTPTPPDPLEVLNDGVNRDGSLPGCGPADSVVGDYVITFSGTVSNIRFHLTNLENGTFRFFDSASNPINVTRLNGNNEFEVAANAVNSTPAASISAGCETNAGANPNGGCGTIVVPGIYTQLRLTTTDLNPAPTASDGFFWTMSALGPTAANASISGRVATADGRGVPNASISVTGGNLETPRYAISNPFGYFHIADLPVGQTYIVTASSKRFFISNSVETITLMDDFTGLHFVAEPF